MPAVTAGAVQPGLCSIPVTWNAVRPNLVVNPQYDRAFIDSADRALSDGAATPGDLERRLRETYPDAVVRSRELAGEKAVTWYAYREGHWVSGRHSNGGAA